MFPEKEEEGKKIVITWHGNSNYTAIIFYKKFTWHGNFNYTLIILYKKITWHGKTGWKCVWVAACD